MSEPHRPDPTEILEAALRSSDSTPIEAHLETALESADSDAAKYHLREAYQKCIILDEAKIC